MRRLAAPLLALLLFSGCRFFAPPGPLLLLITVDTLRADHLGAYGSRDPTPSLDRLAGESLVFTAAYAPASFTLPSLSALLTSRYPEEVGVDGNSTVLAPVTTLAGWLRNRGYRTAAVVSNFVLRPSSGFGAGFESYDATFPQHEAVRRGVPERVAADTTAAALKMLDVLTTERRPAFLWIHYQDTHGPYSPPDDLRGRYLPEELARPDARRALPAGTDQHGTGAIPKYQFFEGHNDPAFYRAGYRAEVAVVDQAIGRLLSGVRERGLMERATVVFTADHGEALGENDYWFSHGERLEDPLTRVPLFLRLPGLAPGRRDEVASLLDVFPTLAARVGGRPPRDLRGRDLLAAGAAQNPSDVYMSTLKVSPVFRHGLVARGHKYLVDDAGGGRRERLSALADEGRDVAAAEPDVLDAMRKALGAARGSLRTVASTKQHRTPEEIENLRSLGYVEIDE